MAYMLYSILNREGQQVRRLGQYADVDELDREVSQHDEQLVDFHVLSDGVGRTLVFLRGKPKPLDIAEFCSTLSYYVSGGVELQGALADTAESTTSASMRTAILDIRRSLRGGYSLSESMRMTGRFPDVAVNMSLIGEESGSLDRMLRDAARHIERVEDIKSAAKRALIYPLFTLVVVGAAGAFWMAVVVPKIVELFEAMQVELEPATLMLIAMSNFVVDYWPWILGTIVAIPFLWLIARRNRRFRVATDHGLWRLPLFGRIVRGGQMSFYYQYLALMYGAGVVITTALDTLQKTVSNKYFADRVNSLLDDLRSGVTLGVAFKQCEVFPVLDQRMVSIGETTGNLDEQLQKLADMHYRRVQALVEVLPKFLEPAMLVLLGAAFGFFIIALMGPLYNMVSQLGGAG
ncbi:MAG: type II secretion system F family protein [Candidatus Sedimenticola sp. (ex Thyasira tokunagai)]